MNWRLGCALWAAAWLAGCAEFPDFFNTTGSSDYAMASPPPAEQAMPEADGSAPAAPAVPPAPSATPPQGKFGVQIAAPRSEADARAVIDTMRAKHSSLLGNQWASINRVALPSGVFYRVLIGPIGSQQEAAQLCSSLKAQGAACFLRGT